MTRSKTPPATDHHEERLDLDALENAATMTEAQQREQADYDEYQAQVLAQMAERTVVNPRDLDLPLPDLVLTQLVDAPLRDQRDLMEFPFFGLTKNPSMQTRHYNDGRVSITIEPSKNGIATIWDKDILIYLTTLVNERIERGLEITDRVQFAAYDLLRVCQRGTGKTDYEQLLNALDRLRGTTIKTSIEAGGARERRGFGWIAEYRVIEKTIQRGSRAGQKIMVAAEVRLSDWMMRALTMDRSVLSIDSRYFELTMGIERRIYELARKHLGQQASWEISLPRLAEKVGTESDLKAFHRQVRTVAERNRLPGLALEIVSAPANTPRSQVLQRTKVLFSHQADTLLLSPEATRGIVHRTSGSCGDVD